jgi:TIR domain
MIESGNRGPESEPNARVFISYSRKDEDFAQELLGGLQIIGFDPFLDKHDIAPGEDWEARLGRLIEAADTVVFVISPDAVASERCAWEVERTEALKKRLLPIVFRHVEEALVPPRLKRLFQR